MIERDDDPVLLSVAGSVSAGTDVDSSYLAERIEEMRSLCDPRVRGTLTAEEIDLHSFTSFVRSRADARY